MSRVQNTSATKVAKTARAAKAKSHKLRWGISADSERLDSTVPFYEIPLASSLPSKGACSASGSFWYLSARDSAEQWERESLLMEACKKIGAEACVLNIPRSLLGNDVVRKGIQRLSDDFEKSSKIPVYFDFGRSGLLDAPDSIDLSDCVFDPIWDPQWDALWRRRAALSPYWKVHGWHSERWVRMYAEKDLQHVLDLADRFRPQFLIFGHSQRRTQYLQLSRHMKTDVHRRISK